MAARKKLPFILRLLDTGKSGRAAILLRDKLVAIVLELNDVLVDPAGGWWLDVILDDNADTGDLVAAGFDTDDGYSLVRAPNNMCSDASINAANIVSVTRFERESSST